MSWIFVVIYPPFTGAHVYDALFQRTVSECQQVLFVENSFFAQPIDVIEYCLFVDGVDIMTVFALHFELLLAFSSNKKKLGRLALDIYSPN